MARNNYTTRVSLELSASQAAQTLKMLQKESGKLAKDLAAAIAAGDKDKAKSLQRQLNNVNGQIRQMQTETRRAADVLRNLDQATPKELRKTLSTLNRELEKLPRGSKEFAEQAAKIREVKAALQEVNGQLREQPSLWDKIKSSGLGGLVAGVASLSGAISLGKEAVDKYVSMEGEMANVRKYTGLAADEVDRLNEEFKNMDTRTSREELNRMAQDAGRLGKQTVEDILGYVRAADQIQVALDDLGADATLTLSKLTGIFGVEKELGTEKALIATGSVINELSQNCSASAPYIAEFTARMGAAGSQAKMTIPQIMALGAVLDTTGQNVEAGSTAVAQFMVRMFRDPAKYAKAAGLDVKQFSELLKKDANEALLTLLESLNKAGGMTNLAPLLADMGEKGSAATTALSNLAGHIDEVRAQQEAANTAFSEATSITEEFGVQNNTAAAKIDKQKKEIDDLYVEIGEKLLPVQHLALTSAKAGIAVVSTIINFVVKYRATITALAVGIAAYTIAVKAAAIEEAILTGLMKVKTAIATAQSVAMGLLTAAYHLASAGLAKLTGNTAKATASMVAYNAVMAANPIGAVVVAITAAIAAFALFGDTVDTTTVKTDKLADVTAKATERREEERQTIEENIRKIEKFNGTKEEEARLIKDLNDRYGPILGRYDTLAKWLKTLKTRGAEYCATVYGQIEAEGKLEAARQLIAEAAKKRIEGEAYNPGFMDTLKEFVFPSSNPDGPYSQYWKLAKERAKKNAKDEAEEMANIMEDAAKELEGEARAKQQEMAAKLAATAVAPDADASRDSDPSDSSYTRPMSDKERKKIESEAKAKAREEAKAKRMAEQKAKKEYKADMDKTEADYNTGLALNVAERSQGLKTWEDFLKEKQRLDIKYFDDRMAVMKKHGLEEDADFAKLLKGKEEKLADFSKKEKKMSADQIREDLARSEAQLQIDSVTPGSDVYKDEKKLQVQLYALRYDAQKKTMELYEEGSEERHREELKLTEMEEAEKLRLRKESEELLADFQNTYVKEKAGDRMQKELDAVKVLYDRKIITENQYQEAVKQIRDKYRDEERQAMGQVSSEWGDLVVGMYDAFKAFSENTGDGFKDLPVKVAAAASAATSLLSSLFSAASSYMQACTDLETAKISKSYDTRIKAAEGNSAKQKKLEEQKERAISREKAKAAEKNFGLQVALAVAQTAQSAIAAYTAGLSVGGLAGLILAPIAAATAIAAGGVQIATIKKQKEAAAVNGYSEGGFTEEGPKDKPAGIVHAGEWVASQKLLRNPKARPLINMLDYAQRTNSFGSITPSDVSRSVTAPMVAAVSSGQSAPTPPKSESDERTLTVTAAASAVNARLTGAVERLSEVLSQPIVAHTTVTGEYGTKTQTDRYNQLIRNKSKQS